MRLALLIGNAAPRLILDALQSMSEPSALVSWAASEWSRSRLRDLFPSVEFVDHWDRLLTESLDGVLVCDVSPEILSAARQLAHRNVRLFILVEAASSPAKLFEFMPVWQEHPHQLIPLYLSGMEQASRLALQQFAERHLGSLWKLEFHRILQGTGSANPLCSLDAIDRMLLQDLHWICETTGFPQHVTMQFSGASESPAEVTILLGGNSTPEIRWTLRSHAGPEAWTLKLIGHDGELEFASQTGRPESLPLPVSMPSSGQPADILDSNEHSVDEARVRDLILQIQHGLSGAAPANTSSSEWLRLVQLAEIGAVAQRSRQRRRTLDVHFGEASERSQFKTQMTALGCGTLLWTMFGMISLLILGNVLDPRDREYRQSAAAGFVLHQEQFETGQSRLTTSGRDSLRQIVTGWSETSPVLILEESPREAAALNQMREQTVLQELTAGGVRNPQGRMVLRPLHGTWFETAMTLAWVLVFSPLVVVLLLQFLILLSRDPALPAGSRTS